MPGVKSTFISSCMCESVDSKRRRDERRLGSNPNAMPIFIFKICILFAKIKEREFKGVILFVRKWTLNYVFAVIYYAWDVLNALVLI